VIPPWSRSTGIFLRRISSGVSAPLVEPRAPPWCAPRACGRIRAGARRLARFGVSLGQAQHLFIAARFSKFRLLCQRPKRISIFTHRRFPIFHARQHGARARTLRADHQRLLDVRRLGRPDMKVANPGPPPECARRPRACLHQTPAGNTSAICSARNHCARRGKSPSVTHNAPFSATPTSRAGRKSRSPRRRPVHIGLLHPGTRDNTRFATAYSGIASTRIRRLRRRRSARPPRRRSLRIARAHRVANARDIQFWQRMSGYAGRAQCAEHDVATGRARIAAISGHGVSGRARGSCRAARGANRVDGPSRSNGGRRAPWAAWARSARHPSKMR